MAQLTASVQRYGVLEPILLKPLQSVQELVRYELVFGERRYLAAEAAGLNEIRARILTPEEVQQWKEVDIAQIRLIENLNREDLNAVEETHAIVELLALQLQISATEVPRLCTAYTSSTVNAKVKRALLPTPRVGTLSSEPLNEQFSQWINNSDDAVMFERVLWEVEYAFEGLGRFSWQSFVQHRLPLLNLPVDVQNAIRAGQLPYSAGKAVARITDEDQRRSLLEQAIAAGWTREQIAEAVRSQLTSLSPSSESDSDPATQFRATLQTTVSKLRKVKLSPKNMHKQKNCSNSF